MLLLTAIVTFAAVWFTAEISRNEGAFYSCLLFISAGAIGAFASIDLFFFYAFHELALIPTFLLIGIWGTGNRQTAAWKITIYLAIGSFILLLGLILLYRSLPEASRSFDFAVLQAAASAGQISVGAQQNIYLVLLIGFGILISLFPFHTWAPEAYASAPCAGRDAACGRVEKIRTLRIAASRHSAACRPARSIGTNFSSSCCSETSSTSALSRSRRNGSIGCSVIPASCTWATFFSVSPAQTLLGIYGAAILMFAHGLSIALLFGITGELRRRTGTLVFEDLGGLAKVMPFAGFVFGLAAFAAIGLPGFANFAGEVLIFFGAFRRGANMLRFDIFQVATTLALWGVVISAVYMLRAYRAVFMGRMESKWSGLPDLRNSLRLPITLLVAALLCGRIFPAIVRPDRHSAVPQLFRREVIMIGAPTLEIAVILLGTGLLLLEAFSEKIEKEGIAYAAIAGLIVILLASFFVAPAPVDHPSAFWNFYTADPLAIFFKRFALVTTIFVLDHDDRLRADRTQSLVHGVDSAIGSRRIFRASDLHLRRPDVDGVRDRLRHDLRLARAGYDFVLRAGQFYAAQSRDARSRREISDSERALDRLSRLRHYLDFRRDGRNESRSRSRLP